MALPLLATSIWTMAVLMFCAGLPIAPVVAALYGQIGRVAAAGSVAEAFSWFGTSVSIGHRRREPLPAGRVIDGHGWRAAVVARDGFLAAGAIVTTFRRSTLAPPAGPRPQCPLGVGSGMRRGAATSGAGRYCGCDGGHRQRVSFVDLIQL